jgi:hypothetical protein
MVHAYNKRMADDPDPQQPTDQLSDSSSTQRTPTVPKQGAAKRIFALVFSMVVLAGIVTAAALYFGKNTASTAPSVNAKSTKTTSSSIQGVQLNTYKDYGNKYASGVVPVGDGKYKTSGAQQGYIYACDGYAQNLTSGTGGGASVRGPWFTDTNTEYNFNKKVNVEGSVSWQGSFTNNISGSTRVITTNDLPIGAITGTFPISSSDIAYSFDRNPNSIKAQSFTFNLPANPTYGNPQCEGGSVGVMTNGVVLFNGFDAEGRDAGAWEVQDSCAGHPESTGVYHYHTLSPCIKDIGVQTVIGYALDGFPITGPKIGTSDYLTTSDLDQCHGITSPVMLDGKLKTTYHYVMTQDFPYSVSCFRGTPIHSPTEQAVAGGQPAPQPQRP